MTERDDKQSLCGDKPTSNVIRIGDPVVVLKNLARSIGLERAIEILQEAEEAKKPKLKLGCKADPNDNGGYRDENLLGYEPIS